MLFLFLLLWGKSSIKGSLTILAAPPWETNCFLPPKVSRSMLTNITELIMTLTNCSDGWLTILSRGQHSNLQDFFDKTFLEMQYPFGDPQKEYWFGLKNLYELTNQGLVYELKIEFKSAGSTPAYLEAFYGKFQITENANFTLYIDDYNDDKSTAPDNLLINSGAKFAAKDYDPHGTGCPGTYQGPWWFRADPVGPTCTPGHLMGPNLNTDSAPTDRGIQWPFPDPPYAFRDTDSLAEVRMKVRPKWMNKITTAAYCVDNPTAVLSSKLIQRLVLYRD